MCRNVTTLNDGWRNAVVLITLAAQSKPTNEQEKRQDNKTEDWARPRQTDQPFMSVAITFNWATSEREVLTKFVNEGSLNRALVAE